MMDVDQLEEWRAADALFDQWLDQPEPGRDAWLAAQEMPGPVRRRLLQLVRAHERTGSALDRAAGDLAGRTLGDWTLESELGRGGMAVVYLARRDQGMACQRAAVKVLTLAALGAGGRERFQREAGILARLGHPNITRLIDSGVADDGTCWLAMPLVEGERIDRWCQARGLDARAIVQLYLQVCAAVAYAHRNLVIHRDLKPSNVLVDADGNVHLLDFGIGQFADVPAERTRTQWRALTPGYAAPEQLRGELPTTAIDVYGLGSLLHRLLTGRTPGAPTGNGDTTRPSQLVRSAGDAYHRHYVPLKNDLDLVLLKALAEEPERRYPSVEALALDLRRWLEGEPVQAEKPRLAYRLRKFAVRNKAGVAAAVLVAASLAAGVGTTLWQAGEARREAGNAQVQAQRAILVRDFLARVFASTEPTAGGVPDALELLEEGARRARTEVLGTDPLAAADILMLTGAARVELDALDEAVHDLRQAARILSGPGLASYRELSRIEGDLSRAMWQVGNPDAAIAHGHRAVEFAELALEENGDPAPYLHARLRLGEALSFVDPVASLAEFEFVLEAISANGLGDTALHLDALRGVSDQTPFLPHTLDWHVERAEEIIRLSRLIEGPDSGRLAFTLANNTRMFLEAGRYDRAGQVAFEAVELADRIYEGSHSTKALAYCAAANHLYYSGKNVESLELYAVADGLHAQLPNNQQQIESCIRMSGHAHLSVGQTRVALERLERAWHVLGQLDYRATKQGYDTCGLLATARLRAGQLQEAEHVLGQCPDVPGAPEAILRTQAQAELHFARGEFGDAARLTSALRRRHPPTTAAAMTQWMRPWMLDALMAHQAGDTAGEAALVAELGRFGTRAPLSQCLARPDTASCLAVP